MKNMCFLLAVFGFVKSASAASVLGSLKTVSPLHLFLLMIVVFLVLIKLIRRFRRYLAFQIVARKYLKWIEENKGKSLTPLAEVSIRLRPGERAFWEENVALIESKSVRTHMSAGPSFRVARGVYMRMSRGRSKSHKEWQITDHGVFTITDERIVFTGDSESFSIPMTKVISTKAHRDSIQFNCDARKSFLIFVVKNSLIVNEIVKTILTALAKASEE